MSEILNLSKQDGCENSLVYTPRPQNIYMSNDIRLPLQCINFSWWRHQMETFFALLALCAGNSPVTGEFPAQRPVTRSFDVFFDLRPNWQLSKQSWGWWFETPSHSLWRHSNVWLGIAIFFWIKRYRWSIPNLCHLHLLVPQLVVHGFIKLTKFPWWN